MLHKSDKGAGALFNPSIFKVANALFSEPNKILHLRMLEKETGLSTTAVTHAVDGLLKEGVLKIERTNLALNIQADLSSDRYKHYKRIFNLYNIERNGLIMLLRDAFHPEAIVLFGSYAKGEDIEESDIDILIISGNKDDKEVRRISNFSEQKIKRKLDLLILPSLKDSSPEFRNAVANGIVLYGYLKVV